MTESRRVTRRARRALRTLKQRWQTRRPQTFNEKVRYKIARDRRPLLVTFADKLAARSYVEASAASCELTKLYAVASDLSMIERSDLPREFVVKVNHASGGVVIVSELAPLSSRTPTPDEGLVRRLVHPDALDWSQLTTTTREWLDTVYDGYFGEWAYAQVAPRVFVEELLTDGGKLPMDYKLWTFHGTCRVIEVAVDRYGDLAELLFTPSWELLADLPGDDAVAEHVQPPTRLDTMIEVAETLGRETDFVRVDLYECDGRIVFGELTSYPGGGVEAVASPRLDELLGSYWHVPRSYRRLRPSPNAARHR